MRFGMYKGNTIPSFTTFVCASVPASVVVVVVVVVVGTSSADAIALPTTVEAGEFVSGNARLSDEDCV
jgi:hypothetical protein